MMILQTQGQPLNLSLTLDAGQAFRWRKESGSEGWWNGVISGQLVRIRQQEVDGDLEFEGAPGPDGDVGELLHRYFRLDDPIAEIYQSISRNDAMAELVERYHGLRLLRQDPWECLVSYICSANNSVPQIKKLVDQICAKFGSPINGHEQRAFPSYQQIAAADPNQLEQLKLGLKRAENIHKAAQAVQDQSLDFDSLRENPSWYSVVRELKTLDGVGDKISHCVALFSLDKLDAFPVDRHIAAGLGQVMQIGRSGSRKQAQDYFGPYAGYAGQFIFHDIRTQSER